MSTISEHGAASDAAERALVAIAAQTASMASPEVPAAEYLELLRLWLHIRIDALIDEESLRHPSPLRCIARTARYFDLLNGWDHQ